MSKKVFVGLSGGVDSSVTAALLVKQGYEVTGVYMKNWSKAIGSFECPWQEDYRDAKRVAVRLRIPFEMVDFETEYFDKVVTYMLDAFKAGITPNPDVMCNQEIKFKLFFDYAMSKGADYVATGHYAQVDRGSRIEDRSSSELNSKLKTQNSKLLRAYDENKDQTYFLYRMSKESLERTLFPLGGLTKPEVRKLAEKFNLPTAAKKESMGICFVGKIGIKEFLKQYVATEPGDIKNQHNMIIGKHEGAIFYTYGQRHGLDVGGGLPLYVTHKDMSTNTVYVTNNIDDEQLWTSSLRLTSTHWLNEPSFDEPVFVRTRHRGQLIPLKGMSQDGEFTVLELAEPLRAATPGQSAVLYSATECFGGGIIS